MKINWTSVADIPAFVWGGITVVVISVISVVLWLKNVPVGDIAAWVAALGAIGGLWFAGVQIQSARDIQREATANEIWMNYEQRGLEYPKYANPELSKLDCEKKTLDGDLQEFYKYEWFVSFMLLACDAVLLLGHRWDEVVKRNLRYHRDYLTSKLYEEENLHFQSTTIQDMIKELKQEEGN